MHLKTLRLKNFKKFASDEGFEIKFPADLTVVVAPNESGKSTIVSAITACLFLNPKTAKAKIFQSWQSAKLPEVTIVFEENNETFELMKNFEIKEAVLLNLNTGEKITNFEQIQKIIADIFGFGDEEIFNRVFSIDQNAFYGLDNNETTLQESLENLVAGAGSKTVSEIISSLEKELTSITRQGLKNPGHLQRLNGEISRIDEVLSDFDTKLSRFENLTSELSLKLSQLEKIDKDFNFKKQQAQFSKEFGILNKDLNRVDGNLEKLEKTHDDLVAVNEKLRDFKEFGSVDIDKLKDRVKDLMGKVRFKRWSEESILSKFVRKNYQLLKYILIISVAIFLGLSMVNLVFIFLSLISLAVALAITFLNYRISKTYQLRMASKDLETILNKFNAKSEEALYQRINEVSALFWEKSKLEHTFATFGGENAFMKQKDERKKTLRLFDALKLRAEELGVDIVEDEAELKKLSREVDVVARNRDELKDAVAKIQGELKGLSFSGEDKIRMEEIEASFIEELNHWQKKMKILETTRDLLSEAREKTLVGVKDRLIDYVSGFLDRISGGKYKKISIDQNFSFKVFSDEKGSEIVPEDDLSRGSIDQFYLALRFAFVKVLAKNKKSFMVLDDPFHNFDEDRKLRTKKLLQDLSEEFQVILFSHSKEYDDWGSVVNLK